VFATNGTVFDPIVWPSGGARATTSVPIVPDAPVRLSITTCWPRFSESLAPVRRARMSTLPPGAKGTIQRIGFVG
jgi:hypothetical protein